jgi:hypothetical protein
MVITIAVIVITLGRCFLLLLGATIQPIAFELDAVSAVSDRSNMGSPKLGSAMT